MQSLISLAPRSEKERRHAVEVVFAAMSIPDFQKLMFPLLTILDDEQEHTIISCVQELSDRFELTLEERNQKLPSGRQTYIANRIAWAATHLSKAKLIARTGRGRVRIQSRGLESLRSGTEYIGMKYLDQFPEYQAFRNTTNAPDDKPQLTLDTAETTPVELLETNYAIINGELTESLLEILKKVAPAFFEQVVVDLLVAMGYGGSRADAGQAVGGSGDGGIDGIIKEDQLGLDFVYIQAKRWNGPVSRPIVQAFAGSLEGQRANKGVLITTSHFTQEAIEYVSKIAKRIVLIDGKRLSALMIEHGVGVAEIASYTIKRIDADYFGEYAI